MTTQAKELGAEFGALINRIFDSKLGLDEITELFDGLRDTLMERPEQLQAIMATYAAAPPPPLAAIQRLLRWPLTAYQTLLDDPASDEPTRLMVTAYAAALARDPTDEEADALCWAWQHGISEGTKKRPEDPWGEPPP